MLKVLKTFLYFFWFLAVTAVIGAAATPDFMVMDNGADKMLHITAFCLLMMGPAVLLFRRKYIMLCALGLLAAGIGIEIIQQYVPGREASMEDILADLAGISLGLLLGYLFRGEHNPSDAALLSRKAR